MDCPDRLAREKPRGGWYNWPWTGSWRGARVNGNVFPRFTAALVCLCASSGCGVLSTTTELPPPAPARTVTRQELIDTIQRIAAIQSMRAIIQITLTVQSEDRVRETRYRDARGALVLRRPGWIRTNAEVPGGIAKVYDMVSDGTEFKVYVPFQNRVYQGVTDLIEISENRFENIRPQHLLQAIMLDPIEDESRVILDIEMYGQSGYQVLHVVEDGPGDTLRIRRKYWFSRDDLKLSRLMILDDETEVATDAWYRDWLEDNGLPYPQELRIERPQDGYEVEIEISRPGLNADVPDASFELALPSDVVVERIGDPEASSS